MTFSWISPYCFYWIFQMSRDPNQRTIHLRGLSSHFPHLTHTSPQKPAENLPTPNSDFHPSDASSQLKVASNHLLWPSSASFTSQHVLLFPGFSGRFRLMEIQYLQCPASSSLISQTYGSQVATGIGQPSWGYRKIEQLKHNYPVILRAK